MLESLRELQSNLERLEVKLRALSSTRVQQRGILDNIRLFIDFYFRSFRGSIAGDSIPEDLLLQADDEMSRLLEMTHHRSSATSYRACLRRVKGILIGLERAALLATSRDNNGQNAPVDQAIIDTLQVLVPSAACSYGQAIQDLRAAERLSWRGPATDLRESLRETLDVLAPDKEVVAEAGFKLEKDANGPTMKQKVRYILKKRAISKTSSQSSESAVDTVEGLLGSFVRSVYRRSSQSTHTPTDRNEAIRVRDLVRITLCELLEIHM